jgi:bifunctional DNA-binding transcriptional regulator/antitoxin component of YhaV-PrlF toxin-antitoxin module
MAVVIVDERGRLTIPSELHVRDTKATLIPAGPFLIKRPHSKPALGGFSELAPHKAQQQGTEGFGEEASTEGCSQEG